VLPHIDAAVAFRMLRAYTAYHKVGGCPDQCNEPKYQGKCNLDYLRCECYCDDGFCCSVWPHAHAHAREPARTQAPAHALA
jgi:hypothetical protein